MNRRKALLTLAGAGAASAVAGAGVLTFRPHRDPRRTPFLTSSHLQSLATAQLERPRVLFIGNSMILRHDVPGLTAEQAALDGHRLSAATAAADGARLIETLRLDAVRAVLRPGFWDAVILQDFTKTPLRAFDRWGSDLAMGDIGKRVAPSPVILYPPWPATSGNSVYRDAGFLTATPASPDVFRARTMAFYEGVARKHGFHVAPVPEAWAAAADRGEDLFHPDGHHANANGADLIAKVLWPAIRDAMRA